MSNPEPVRQPPFAPPRVRVVLAPALLKLFPSAVPRVELSASTVDELIDLLNDRWPGMRDRLCDSTPGIRRHINVFVGGERAALETPLTANSEVFILTSISGG